MDPVRRAVGGDDGAVISYLVFDGALPAIVILHGLAGSGREFESTARALSGRMVVLIDQRGHGFSTREPADTSRGAFIADAVRVIEAESLAPVDLVGQSMGAHTAMLVAAAHPDLVRRLVLLEANEGGGVPEGAEAIGEYFRSWEVPYADREAAQAALGDGELAQAWSADLEERPDGLYPRFDPEVMVATMAELAVPRWTEWESVAAPTLVIYADEGMFTEEQKIRFVSRGVRETRADLTGASHDAHLDAFEDWIGALTGFLRAR
ncbi:pimeloyl-ACP methyl ester carboxylesterase [Arthrobacter sp. CAN_A212]|uniref:alpha/beta fold hydrolase n=1 Tax=Arthrobacter sp. CAN_A212 TaxID=2787719 RepID=UPI0018C92AF3